MARPSDRLKSEVRSLSLLNDSVFIPDYLVLPILNLFCKLRTIFDSLHAFQLSHFFNDSFIHSFVFLFIDCIHSEHYDRSFM